MKKKNIKNLKLRKNKISKVTMGEVKGGTLVSLLCPSQIYQGEDYCVSIPK